MLALGSSGLGFVKHLKWCKLIMNDFYDNIRRYSDISCGLCQCSKIKRINTEEKLKVDCHLHNWLISIDFHLNTQVK